MKLAKMKGKAYGAEHRNKKPDSNDFAASAVKLIPNGAMSLKREGPDKYSLLSTADMMFDLMDSETMSGRDCQAMLSKITGKAWDLMHDVDQSGERMMPPASPPEKGVFLFDDYRDRPESCKEFADYRVKTVDGVQIEGKVIPNVVSFDSKKLPYKLFLSASHSCMQTNIAGVKETNGTPSKAAWFCKQEGRARVGQTGTFVFIDDGKAVATNPSPSKQSSLMARSLRFEWTVPRFASAAVIPWAINLSLELSLRATSTSRRKTRPKFSMFML